MKVGVIVQARTSSIRLPGKVLKELPFGSGVTALGQVIRRLKRANRVDEIIVATSREKEDEAICHIAEKEDTAFFKGDLNNVLERYFLAAMQHKLDTIVRITSDCPCTDPSIVDLVIERHLGDNVDYTSNVGARTYADGFDVEVFNFDVLEEANKNARTNWEREHVTPYIIASHRFEKTNVSAPPELHAPRRRITLDTPQDYALLCAIYEALYPRNAYFGAHEIMELYKEKPWLELINNSVISKADKEHERKVRVFGN